MSVFDKHTLRLAQHGQAHLLRFWNNLREEEKISLGNDLNEINFDEVVGYFNKAWESLKETGKKLDDVMQPIPPEQHESADDVGSETLNKYRMEGLRRVSESQVGVVLMAGGQGTRLGVSYPKGMYDVGLLSGKSLFRIQAERIRRVQQLAFEETGKQGAITWYVMTSEHTIKPTKKYFAENQYFGLEEDNIVMFLQGKMPCFDFDGKILLSSKCEVSQSPDGNGGLYKALRDRGILDDMERRDVKYVHAHSVDNILTQVADPVFIGYCVTKAADCGAKVVRKKFPTEAVGVVCKVDGKNQVVEYSEITDATAHLQNASGELTFNAANICNHFFTADFLRRIGDQFEPQLKLHVARKKIPHVDADGTLIKPDKPNGIKIEKFIFDVFEFTDKFVTWEVSRTIEFSALKNADDAGEDCPSTARNALYALHKKYVEAAGGTVTGDEVEISPLLSYAGEGLDELVKGKHFNSPHLFKAPEEINQ